LLELSTQRLKNTLEAETNS